MDNNNRQLRKITLPIPEKPTFFWYVCEAPPSDTNLLDLALNHEEFIATGKDTGKEYIIERLDFFVCRATDHVPEHITIMALNMERNEAKAYMVKTYGNREVAFFFFKIKEQL